LAPVYYDANGEPKLCGEESGFTTHKYLYITDLSPLKLLDVFHSGVCVDECPKLVSYDKATKVAVYNPEQVPCVASKYVNCDQPLHMRPTIKIMNWCLPDPTADSDLVFKNTSKAQWDATWAQFKDSSAGSYIYDLYLSSTAIYTCMGLAPVWCFIFIAIMSAFAEQIAWFCIVLAQLGMIGGTVVCFMYRTNMAE
jgi:hypothetical protein